ncbi:hypothetical protein Rwratislav_47774 [Rhodococcus wratislaviensis IFP 2016]|nr:hypothetical protein Rwratislav_47774 [Rhodococcus wratislaviensis IFP 2016]
MARAVGTLRIPGARSVRAVSADLPVFGDQPHCPPRRFIPCPTPATGPSEATVGADTGGSYARSRADMSGHYRAAGWSPHEGCRPPRWGAESSRTGETSAAAVAMAAALLHLLAHAGFKCLGFLARPRSDAATAARETPAAMVLPSAACVVLAGAPFMVPTLRRVLADVPASAVVDISGSTPCCT